MRRGMWADDLSAITAISRDAVVRTAELERLGIAKGTISARCGERGPWQRILPGVVLLHDGPPTTLQRNLAALEYGGPDSMLSGHAALTALGYSRSASRNDVLLLVPSVCHRRDWAYVKVERTWRMPTPVRRGLLRLAPPERSLLDAARRTLLPDRCRALLADGIQRGDVTVDDLARELASGSHRGSHVPRAVLRELSEDAHSVAEVHARMLYGSSDLPPLQQGVDLLSATGQWLARPEGWLDDVALAWELDSPRYHFSPELHEATIIRRARMQREGIVVVSHSPEQISAAPATVLADLRAARSLAASRPRPSVFAVTGHTQRSPGLPAGFGGGDGAEPMSQQSNRTV
ncbi:hypothetical protein R4282_30700 [Rhodococcus oxybenzonivorans]|uniref:hypothetical protein n=1 Tax=Rhodococcus oxybenzonivorans TaxID=1990687 RepID=UPI0029535514|nr:hypothetical protein [Rhodococcus oxybenzonivorans]MDV7357374.1 hypothetical protein [Rhodococcus oxybenzonivorans]